MLIQDIFLYQVLKMNPREVKEFKGGMDISSKSLIAFGNDDELPNSVGNITGIFPYNAF